MTRAHVVDGVSGRATKRGRQRENVDCVVQLTQPSRDLVCVLTRLPIIGQGYAEDVIVCFPHVRCCNPSWSRANVVI